MKHTFFWGNSVSSMQTEGGWNEGGKSLSVYDIREAGEHTSDWHFANDNYHHFEEDMDLMKDLGMNMYRFQISWSRCVKDGYGEFNEEGLQYYDRFIDALIERGIEPMICLYHFDMPLYLAEHYDGFLSKETVRCFVRFGKKIIDRYAHKVKYWITFNEQNLYTSPIAYRIAGVLEAEPSEQNLLQITHNVMAAHCMLSNYLHEHTDAQIGGMLAYTPRYPASCRPEDIRAAEIFNELMFFNLLDVFAGRGYSPLFLKYLSNHDICLETTEEEMEAIRQCCSDYLAFSYYQSGVIDSQLIPADASVYEYGKYGNAPNPYLKASEWGWQIDPEGFRMIMTRMYSRYRIPVFPIENGIGVRETWNGTDMIEDDYRISYHRDHIKAMKEAMELDGVEVLGYLGWGLIDILSSQGDMEKRYGVVYVNRGNHDLRDMKRVRKKSYYWLKQVIASNGDEL
ncbi:MAG: glycoside hydrolase family 1 protein [Erysipelotrichaceae bacterium]|nr:glycoside hydrolase family 1 protein [Erysipelotrichaceae bacterium]